MATTPNLPHSLDPVRVLAGAQQVMKALAETDFSIMEQAAILQLARESVSLANAIDMVAAARRSLGGEGSGGKQSK